MSGGRSQRWVLGVLCAASFIAGSCRLAVGLGLTLSLVAFCLPALVAALALREQDYRSPSEDPQRVAR